MQNDPAVLAQGTTAVVMFDTRKGGRLVPHLQKALLKAGCTFQVLFGFSNWSLDGANNDVVRALLGVAGDRGDLRMVVINGSPAMVVQGMCIAVSLLGGETKQTMLETTTIWVVVGEGRLREEDGGILLGKARDAVVGTGHASCVQVWETLRGPSGLNRELDLQGLKPKQFPTPVVRLVGNTPLLVWAVRVLYSEGWVGNVSPQVELMFGRLMSPNPEVRLRMRSVVSENHVNQVVAVAGDEDLD